MDRVTLESLLMICTRCSSRCSCWGWCQKMEQLEKLFATTSGSQEVMKSADRSRKELLYNWLLSRGTKKVEISAASCWNWTKAEVKAAEEGGDDPRFCPNTPHSRKLSQTGRFGTRFTRSERWHIGSFCPDLPACCWDHVDVGGVGGGGLTFFL